MKYLTEITMEIDTSVRKFLGIKTYIRWLTTGIIEQETFNRIGLDMKISQEDIDRMIMEVREKQLESDWRITTCGTIYHSLKKNRRRKSPQT